MRPGPIAATSISLDGVQKRSDVWSTRSSGATLAYSASTITRPSGSVRAPARGTLGAGGASVTGPLSLDGTRPPTEIPICGSDILAQRYERTARGEDLHKVLFATGSDKLTDSERGWLALFLESVVARFGAGGSEDARSLKVLDTRIRIGLARSSDCHAGIERRRSRDVNRENSHGRAPRSAVRSEARRIHHSPLFWVGVVMFLAAIVVYVWSEDLSRLPWG